MNMSRSRGSALCGFSAITLTVAASFACAGCGASDSESVGSSQFALTNIGNAADFRSKLTADPYGSYLLTADIDLNGTALHVANFYGQLDGGGHSIKNLRQVLSLGSGEAGLFGLVQGATIKNLKLTTINVQAMNAGGLARNCWSATIRNVSVSGNIMSAGMAGAICSGMSGGSITDSSASGTVTSTTGEAGG